MQYNKQWIILCRQIMKNLTKLCCIVWIKFDRNRTDCFGVSLWKINKCILSKKIKGQKEQETLREREKTEKNAS